MTPGSSFELVAGVSAGVIGELIRALAGHRRPERLVVVTPGETLPADRWTMDWPTLETTIEIGRRDMTETIDMASSGSGHVVFGQRSDDLWPSLVA